MLSYQSHLCGFRPSVSFLLELSFRISFQISEPTSIYSRIHMIFSKSVIFFFPFVSLTTIRILPRRSEQGKVPKIILLRTKIKWYLYAVEISQSWIFESTVGSKYHPYEAQTTLRLFSTQITIQQWVLWHHRRLNRWGLWYSESTQLTHEKHLILVRNKLILRQCQPLVTFSNRVEI